MRDLRDRLDPVLLALAAAVFVLFAASRAFDPELTFRAYFHHTHHHIGLRLVHGLPEGGVTYSMPFTPTLLVALERAPRQLAELLCIGLELAPPLLAFSLAWLLGGAACGLLALAAAVTVTPVWQLFAESSLEIVVFGVALLLAAHFLALDAGKPSRRTAIAAGLALGLSLLIRSPLFLFPLLYLALRPDRRRLWPLLAMPLLLLLPWIYLNWRLYGRFILFEEGRANLNMVSGAMGAVHTLPGSGKLALELSGLEPGASALWWAIRYVAAHPIEYLMAIPLRLWLMVRLHPALFVAAAAGAWLQRREPGARAVALLVAYYMGIHILLPVEPRYFGPIWPLLAVLAALILPRLAPSLDRPSPGAPRRAFWVAAAVLAPGLAFAAYALGLALTYPERAAATGRDLGAVAQANPREPILWHLYGTQCREAGDLAAAADAFGQALRLDPREEYRLAYLRARTACLGRRLFVAGSSPLVRSLPRGFWLVDIDLAQALVALQTERRAEASRSFARFARTFLDRSCAPRDTAYEAFREADLRVLLNARSLEWLRQEMAGWPGPDRDAVYRRLRALGLLPS